MAGAAVTQLLLFASAAHAEQGQVRADTGGIAVGGNVENSCIGDCSLRPEQLQALIQPWKDLSDAQKTIIAGLEHDLALNKQQVQAALHILGERNVPPERLESKLIEVAERFKALQEQIASTQPGDDAQIVALKADAQKALDAGDLARADALLAEIEAQQRGSLDRLVGNAAETSGRRGDIALTRLQYLEAAKHFANAAATFPPGGVNEDKRVAYLEKEADALFRQGNEFGDNSALVATIDLRKQLLALRPRERYPPNWAMTQHELGVALVELGARESESARLEEAVEAFQAALTEWTREGATLDWAQAINDLGIANLRLGERESGTNHVDEAIADFHAALEVRTRERVPFDWAQTQTNLGIALTMLGKRDSRMTQLIDAVGAFRMALDVYTRDRLPLKWAMTQNGLGNSLVSLGELESGTTSLEEAVAAYKLALEERTRERDPLRWALTQSNLGHALATLGERESGTARIEQAVAAYRPALEEETRKRVPLEWAMVQSDLCVTLTTLGGRESGTARLEELEDAVAACKAALEEETRERLPLQWAGTQTNLGDALAALGAQESGTARLEEAVTAFGEALKERTRERVPIQWATSFGAQGIVLILIAYRTNDGGVAETALRQIQAAYDAARSGADEPLAAKLQAGLVVAQMTLNLLKGQ
jgi:tetratricopeptide (TPR) repeat protein